MHTTKGSTQNNSDTDYPCSFFVVPGYGTPLLGIPGCEWLKLLSTTARPKQSTQWKTN